jgi:hypothetical protein
MGRLTTYAANAILSHMTGTAYTPVATVYLALCATNPGDAATGASCGEVANANGYTRRAIPFAKYATRGVANSSVVLFPKATGSYTPAYWGIIDSGTYGAGNCLAYGAFTAPISVVANYYLHIDVGECVISMPSTQASGFGITNEYANSILNLMFNNTAFAAPSTYIALVIDPGIGNTTYPEITGTDVCCGIVPMGGYGYAEQKVNEKTGASPHWTAAASRSLSNAHSVVFTGVWKAEHAGWMDIIYMEIRSTLGTVTSIGSPVSMFYATSTADLEDIFDPAESDTVEYDAGTIKLTIG